MGSLLPGWDTDPHETTMGIKEELHTEKEMLENELRRDKQPLSNKTSIDVHGTAKLQLTGPPDLARKSAPSSVVIKEMLKEEEEKDTSEKSTNDTEKLYARDKWWRKFSSAHLNELALEAELQTGKHTYTPQFDLAGGDRYIKH